MEGGHNAATTANTEQVLPPGHSLQLLSERMASRHQKTAQRNQVQGCLLSSPPLGLELCKDLALGCNCRFALNCLLLQPQMCRTPKAPYSAGAKIRINSQHLKYKVKTQRRNGNREEQINGLYPLRSILKLVCRFCTQTFSHPSTNQACLASETKRADGG